MPPPGDWYCWLVVAGRGFGKTRLGVEWVRSRIEGTTPLAAAASAPARVALIADTLADGRAVMIDGESGFLACAPADKRPHYEASRRRLVWPNGAQAILYSAEEPDQLRGPQHHLAWADELAKWRYGEENWSNLILGLRLGERPQIVATTTPRPIALLRQIMAEPGTVVTRGGTFENRANLPARFLDQIASRYGGTRLGRQEIDGEILETVAGALWRSAMIDPYRIRHVDALERIVVAVDPPVTAHQRSDACGIIAAGRMHDGHYVVLADHTIERASPHQWATQALELYRALQADRLVAEVNNGGDLVETLVRGLEPDLSYRAVRASRGKLARAEPVAALYERGLVHHAGTFIELEDQMLNYVPGNPGSPDRLDALVWALTDLALGGADGAPPRIRPLSGA
ncbi:MAG: ATP-binding protein [Alphaproteobacteria bacterium]|nr:MAG: ATP-binding protein [Alphaproteobacteria bacterium]